MNIIDSYRVVPGAKVRLDEHDPGDAGGLEKDEGARLLEENLKVLADLQYLLYAENQRALLVVLQAMDAGGKDGVIRHVITGMNPQGVNVYSFKQPTPLELEHDFLWRFHLVVPARGEVAIFNRSHYEDVLIARVNKLVAAEVWRERYARINQFERLLADGYVTILKFFLHISKDEQKERLQKRLDDPEKHWKFNRSDLEQRRHWDKYMRAYEDAITECSTDAAPWHIIPANRKWFRDWAVSEVLVQTLRGLKMKFPEPKPDLSKLVIE